MLTKSRVSDLHTFEKWTSIMMDKFEPNGETTDLQDLLYRMTIDVITDYLLGESVGSLQNARSEFAEAFTTVQRWQMLITFML
jgi:cytochrome P450